jgi:riboflavin synthase
MFSGIVQAVGRVRSVKPFEIESGRLPLGDVKVGDSICVQGVCLTVTAKRGKALRFDVSHETLRVTTGLDRTGEVNLEKALRFGDPIGGHFVTGHVDGVGVVVKRQGNLLQVKVPRPLGRYVARKGSICIDGVSLTVNRVQGLAFEVNLIPHTLKVTTMKRLTRGAKVNLEVDPAARYRKKPARLSPSRERGEDSDDIERAVYDGMQDLRVPYAGRAPRR